MAIPSEMLFFFNSWRSRVAQANITRAKSLARASSKDARNILGYIQWDANINHACNVALRETESFGTALASWATPAGEINAARAKALEAIDTLGKALDAAKLTEEAKMLFGPSL